MFCSFLKILLFFPYDQIFEETLEKKIVSRLSCEIIFLQRHENYKTVFYNAMTFLATSL